MHAMIDKKTLLRPSWCACDMQAEVDKQDDMPDFSKTDAYRSSKQRQSEEQASAPAHQKLPPTGPNPPCILSQGWLVPCSSAALHTLMRSTPQAYAF